MSDKKEIRTDVFKNDLVCLSVYSHDLGEGRMLLHGLVREF